MSRLSKVQTNAKRTNERGAKVVPSLPPVNLEVSFSQSDEAKFVHRRTKKNKNRMRYYYSVEKKRRQERAKQKHKPTLDEVVNEVVKFGMKLVDTVKQTK